MFVVFEINRHYCRLLIFGRLLVIQQLLTGISSDFKLRKALTESYFFLEKVIVT